MLKRFVRTATVLVLAVGGVTCVDFTATGPGVRVAALNITPAFSVSPDDPVVPLTAFRFEVRRLPGMELVLNRVVTVGSEPLLSVDLTVPLLTATDRFDVRIAAVDARGDTAYTARVPDVGATVGPQTNPVAAPLVYTGSDTVIASVRLAPRDTTLWVGDTAQLRATAITVDGLPRPAAILRFVSRDTNRVSILTGNRMRAKAAATGTWIVVSTANGRNDSTRVNTLARTFPGVVRVDAGADRAFTALGDTTRLAPVARDVAGATVTGVSFAFSSLNSAVATVGTDGVVTSRAVGVADIIAEVDGRSDTVRVTVSQLPVAVQITPTSGTFTALNDSASYAGVVRDRNGFAITGSAIAWSSADTTVATVGATGMVRARKVGATDITARSGGASGTVRITVTQVVASLALSRDTLRFGAIGDTATVVATARDRNGFVATGATTTFATSNAAVATVTSAGLVRMAGNGSATITATSGTRTATAAVVAAQVIESLTLSRDTLRLKVGDTTTLVPTARDRNGSVVAGASATFSSANPAIATVGTGGLVTIKGEGTTSVTATAGARTASAVVIGSPTGGTVPVDAGGGSLRVTPSTATIILGESQTFVADVVGPGGTTTRVTPVWAVDQPARLAITTGGVGTATAVGSVVVTATYSGLGAKATVTVTPAPQLTSFSFSPRALTGVTSSALSFTVSANATDGGAGIASFSATFTAPGGATQSCTATTPTFGTRANGGWDCVITIPAGSPAGTWHATQVTLTGTVTRNLDETTLATYGGTTLEVRP